MIFSVNNVPRLISAKQIWWIFDFVSDWMRKYCIPRDPVVISCMILKWKQKRREERESDVCVCV